MKWTATTVLIWLAIVGGGAFAHNACDPELLLRPLSPEQRAWRTNTLNGASKALAVSSQALKVSTWNMNLLNVRGWRAPFYKINSQRLDSVLGHYLHAEAPDVVFLQEIWSEFDRQTVRLTAAAAEYETVESLSVPGQRHGLQILVRRGTVAEILAGGFEEFQTPRALFEKIGSVRRGLLWAKIRLNNGLTVLFGNTHFTAFSRYSDMRVTQIEELRRVYRELNPDVDTAVIGGDLNIAADFEEPKHFARHVGKLKSTRWLYDEFAEVTGLWDIFRSAEPQAPGYTFSSRLGGGPERRLDYLWAGELTPQARMHVLRAERKFTEAIDGVYASDHFLVQAVIDFFQIPKP